MDMSDLQQFLSPQEAAIEAGRPGATGQVSDRIQRLFDRIRSTGAPRLTLQRAVLFTESFMQTEGQPIVLRWGKALKHIAQHIDVTIFDDELNVGRPNNWFGRYGLVYGELDGSLMRAAAEHFLAHQNERCAVALTADDRQVIDEFLYPYWSSKDFFRAYARGLPEATRFMVFGPDEANMVAPMGAMNVSAAWRHSQNWVHDYGKILSRGCQGIREEARARLAALENPREIAEKTPFLEAVILTCDAMSIWAQRHAAVAADMAQREANPVRRQELEDIADVCRRVPEHPARSFRDAVQAQWFIQMFSRLEQNVGGQISLGRIDQYLYPYYKRDAEAGRIDSAAAQELLQCVWLNMMQSVEVKLAPFAAASMEGFAHFEHTTIGGQTPDGKDATNELTYVILDSSRPLATSYPELSVRIHSRTPDRLLHATVEAIKDGKGIPKLLNDERIVPFYLANGATLPEALDYAGSGCVESRLPNRETHVTGNGKVNYGVIVEFVLRDGRIKQRGEQRFGLATGDPRQFATYEEVWNAFRAQLLHVVKHIMTQQYVALQLKPRYFAAPMASMLHDLAMDACMDLHRHGEHIPGGIDLSCIESVGLGTAVDSLAAIKHLIYDTKALTWDQLLEAIEHNWEGFEPVRQLCLNAPKYGNGIAWVDAIALEVEREVLDCAHAHPKPHGQSFMFRCIPVTSHVPLGKLVWATPNGRPAQEYLSEGISASHGMDVRGPTTALGSMAASRCLSYKEKGADLINMKFAPATVAGEEGTQRLMQIVRAWCDLKLWHVQFNVINRDTLLAAQKDPEKYRDLVVRVAGYSAYFVDLSPMQQAEIIARTQEAI